MLGSNATDVTVYVLGGAARIPDLLLMKPGKEALVAAAGPASSLVLAAIAFVACAILVSFGMPKPPWILSYTVLINIVLAVFNILPLYPMDGGRILRAACSSRMGHERGTKAAVWTTVALGSVLGIVSFMFGWWSVAIIMPLMILVALGELKLMKHKRLLEEMCEKLKRHGYADAHVEMVDGRWQIVYRE